MLAEKSRTVIDMRFQPQPSMYSPSNPETSDPYPHLPVEFWLYAKMTEDNRILVYMPHEFIGHKITLSGKPNKRCLMISPAGAGVEVKQGTCREGHTIPDGHLFFDGACLDREMTKSLGRFSRRGMRRNGNSIFIGTLLDYLAVDFAAYEETRRIDTPTPIPAAVMAKLAKPEGIRPELEHLREAVKVVNQYAAERGFTLAVSNNILSASIQV